MKSIIKSLLIIVAVAAVAGGATYAYFTHTETVTGNTFSTGSLSFNLRKTNTDTINLPFKFDGMTPGKCADGQLNVFNHSDSITMKYRFYFAPTGGSPIPYDKITVDAYKCDHYDSGSHCASWTLVKSGLLKNLDGSADHIVSPANEDPNISNYWKFHFCLDSSAGNDYQGTTATFNIVGQATQPENPNWTE